jgi:hypothetical protein
MRFGRPGISFRHLDIRNSPLPAGDLLLCKDVLQHWPIADILNFCKKVLRSYKYVLLTNAIQPAKRGLNDLNSEISLGECRTLNLEIAPFNFKASWREDYTVPDGERKRVLFFQLPCREHGPVESETQPNEPRRATN